MSTKLKTRVLTVPEGGVFLVPINSAAEYLIVKIGPSNWSTISAIGHRLAGELCIVVGEML